MKQAVVYSNGSQECERVESLLDSIGVSYQTYHLDQHFTGSQFYNEFGDVEYPQISSDYPIMCFFIFEFLTEAEEN